MEKEEINIQILKIRKQNTDRQSSKINNEEVKSLGINIGSSKTVYSTYMKKNEKFISEVLLMNGYSRIIPSIICYTKDHRLFGENSISSLKQNLNTSYNNLSRIIRFDKNIKYYENEIKYQFNNNIKLFRFANNKEEIKSEYIIGDYLSLINEYYFEKENIKYDICSISVPDFYNPIQKEDLKLICESIGMNNIKIFNESSAITMYYGYTKYKDIFLNKENKIDPNIEKNILFIDAGHSKTSFILSNFKYNEFKVEYVLCDPHLGGRNFDELIFNYCIEEFKKENELQNIEITDKMKYKLIDSIEKSRIKLSVNTEIKISIDSFYEDMDLNINLKLIKFEEIIKNLLNQFEKHYNDILKYADAQKIIIDKIEMAGGLMRTPSLQKIIENNQYTISKTILIDECTSMGASLYDYFMKKKIEQIKTLNNICNFNYYPIYYKIIDNNNIEKEKLFLEKEVIYEQSIIEIKINEEYYNKHKNAQLKLFYFSDSNKNDENIIFENIPLIPDITNKNIIKNCSIQYIFFFNDIKRLLKIKVENEIVSSNDEIYFTDNYIKEFKNRIFKYLKEKKRIDEKYNCFIKEKSNISYLSFVIKNNVEKNKEVLNEEFKKIQIIIKKINKNENNLEELLNNTKELNEIVKQLYMKKEKQLLLKINNSKDIIDKINDLKEMKNDSLKDVNKKNDLEKEDEYLKKYIELINIENSI